MFEIKVKSDIASAHQLHGYDGPCKNVHGHTWKVEAVVESNQLDQIGMVVDFKILKKQLKEVLDPIDHVFLNELPAFKDIPPSTENIAKYIYREFAKVCLPANQQTRQAGQPIKLKQVEVWESESASVVFKE